MRVLVTGIEGFVGSHLARYLAKRGDAVFGLHLLPPKENLPAELFCADLCNFEEVKSVLERSRPEWIFHLAGVSSVAEAEKNPVATYQVNTIGTLKLLLAVHQLMLPSRILLISSADVYGRGDKIRDETHLPSPLTAYAQSKLLAEELGRLYYQAWGMDIVILRPFSHTGPGQREGFVFPKVASHIARVERGETDSVLEMGNLDVRRDYTDVRDIVRAYVLAMERCLPGEIYNVTSGNAIRLQDGVETLLKLARKPIEVRCGVTELRSYEIPFLSGNPQKFKRITGWEPQIPFEQTLVDLLDYYRKALSG